MALALLGLATLLCVFCYRAGLHGPFLLDDIPNIVDKQGQITDPHTILDSLWLGSGGPTGRPLANLSFALNNFLSGLQPYRFKYTNLLLHLLTGLLLFALGRRLLPLLLPDMRPRPRALLNGVLAAAWLLHPMQVSTVLYVVQRMTELSALFSLLAMLCYLAGRQRQLEGRPGAWWLLYLGVPLATLAGLLCKETTALVPLYLALLEFLALRGRPHRRAPVAWLIGLPLLLGGLYALTHLQALLSGYAYRTFSLTDRLRTEPLVILDYLRLVLVPRLSDYSLYHDDFLPRRAWDLASVMGVAGLATLTGLAWTLRQRLPVVSFGLAWFLVSHLLESSFLPLELMFEHRNYLALYGPLLALGGTVPVLLRHARLDHPRLAASLLALALLVPLVGLTAARAQGWRNQVLILLQGRLEHPHSLRVLTETANQLLRQGLATDARQPLLEAIRRYPRAAGPAVHLLVADCLAGIQPPPKRLQAVRRVLTSGAIDPYAAQTLHSLVRLHQQGHCDSLPVPSLVDLLDTAWRTARRRNLPYAPTLALYRARALVLTGDPARVRAAYAGVIARAHPHTVMVALSELAYYQILWGDLPGARASIAELARLSRARPHDEMEPQVERLRRQLVQARRQG